ncbi:MAG: hypothetical protein R3D99_05165 [Altererythrobacter sp.]
MPRLLDWVTRSADGDRSPLQFTKSCPGFAPAWYRFLKLDGRHVLLLGNVCGTCGFFFERIDAVNGGMNFPDLQLRLAKGLVELDDDAIKTLLQVMPKSEYIIGLLRLKVEKVNPLGNNDYFAVEQESYNGGSYYNEPPHDPQAKYFRVSGRSGIDIKYPELDGRAFDFIVPLAAEDSLDEERVQFYEAKSESGLAPTAISLSKLDIKGPGDGGEVHWCLAHYLIDGHHKLEAAARTGQEISLIAFIAIDHGISKREHVVNLLDSFDGPGQVRS